MYPFNHFCGQSFNGQSSLISSKELDIYELNESWHGKFTTIPFLRSLTDLLKVMYNVSLKGKIRTQGSLP